MRGRQLARAPRQIDGQDRQMRDGERTMKREREREREKGGIVIDHTYLSGNQWGKKEGKNSIL